MGETMSRVGIAPRARRGLAIESSITGSSKRTDIIVKGLAGLGLFHRLLGCNVGGVHYWPLIIEPPLLGTPPLCSSSPTSLHLTFV